MNREARVEVMARDYAHNRDGANEVPVMDFHRTHLLLFLNRLSQFLAHFVTPSSSLLSHDMFLIVEAATRVARSDWENCRHKDQKRYAYFLKYFDAFGELAKGLEPLDRGTALCLDTLNTPDHEHPMA